MLLLQKVAAKTFSQFCTSFVSRLLFRLCPDKHLLREETSDTLSAQGLKVWRTLQISPLKSVDSCASTEGGARSRLILSLFFFLNNQHHFLTFPFFVAPSPYTSAICLSISAEWTFLACQSITSRTSQVPDFSIFVFVFNDYGEWGKNWHRSTQYTCYPCHAEDEWPLQEVPASHARPPACYRLLVSGRASDSAWKPYIFHTQTIILVNHIF
jgi:hypothetical protein